MSTNGNGQATPTQDQQWRERHVQASGTIVDFTHGGVQFIGRGPVDLHETVVSVGFASLFQLVGAVMQLMDSKHPQHDEVRRALLPDPRQLTLLTDAREFPDDRTKNA